MKFSNKDEKLYKKIIKKIDKCKSSEEVKELIMKLNSKYQFDFAHRVTSDHPKKRIYLKIFPRIFGYACEIFPEIK